MKKGKILSVLTSAAMAGSMMLSALSTTVSAAVPLGLKLASEKTAYSVSEVRSGNAKAEVKVQLSGTVAESDHIGTLEFCIKPETWGTTDVYDLYLAENNALGTSKTNVTWMGAYNATATSTYSAWKDTAKLNQVKTDDGSYGLLNIYDSDGADFKYDDDHPAKVSISSDSNHGFFRSSGESDIAIFTVYFPADLAEGKYTIGFSDAKCGVFPSGNFAGDDSSMASVTNTGTITFTIGEGETTTATTKATTVTTTDDVPSVPHKTDGTCTLTGGKKTAAPGDKVYLPVYLELGSGTNPNSIEAIGFDISFDTSKATLNQIVTNARMMKTYDPTVTGAGLGNASASDNVDPTAGNYVVTFSPSGTDSITVDPSLPICLLEFTVKDGATGTIPVKFGHNIYGDQKEIEVVHTQVTGQENTYLKPTVVNGLITIGADTTTTTEPKPVEKIYDGSATLKGQKNVKGTVGEKAYVPVYLELGSNVDPKTIEAIGFDIHFNTSKASLDQIITNPRMMKTADPSIAGSGLGNASANDNIDPAAGNYVVTFSPSGTDSITVDPSLPICLLEFTVKEGATGEIPITFSNHLHGDAMPIEIVHTQKTGAENTYLTPIVEDGSIVIDEVTTATTTSTSGEQTTPITVTSVSVVTSVEIVTSVSVVTSVEVVTSYDAVSSIVEVTSYVPVTSIVTETSYVPVTSITYVASVVGTYTLITSISVVPVTSISVVTSIDPVVQTSYVDRVVTSVVEKEVPVDRIVTSIVEKEVPVVSISIVDREVPYNVTVTSIVEKEVPVDRIVTSVVEKEVPVDRIVTSVVEKEVPVVSVSVSEVEKIVTSLVISEVYVDNTTTATTPNDTQETVISFEIPGNDDIENDDTHWYYEDEAAWHLDGIKVYVDGVEQEVSADDLTFSFDGKDGVTPGDVYNKGAAKTNDFEVTVGYKEASTTFKVKIGFRGDVNLSHSADVRDAAFIAKDLAQISMSNKTTIKSKFAIFLGNVYEGAAKANTKEDYKPYDFTVRAAAALASWKAKQPFNGGADYTFYKHLFAKK